MMLVVALALVAWMLLVWVVAGLCAAASAGDSLRPPADAGRRGALPSIGHEPPRLRRAAPRDSDSTVAGRPARRADAERAAPGPRHDELVA